MATGRKGTSETGLAEISATGRKGTSVTAPAATMATGLVVISETVRGEITATAPRGITRVVLLPIPEASSILEPSLFKTLGGFILPFFVLVFEPVFVFNDVYFCLMSCQYNPNL
jgi:hypothetical protein